LKKKKKNCCIRVEGERGAVVKNVSNKIEYCEIQFSTTKTQIDA
jgi:6-phosphogluconate dehydrogenase